MRSINWLINFALVILAVFGKIEIQDHLSPAVAEIGAELGKTSGLEYEIVLLAFAPDVIKRRFCKNALKIVPKPMDA